MHRDQYSDLRSNSPSLHRPERRGFRDRSISWLQASTSLRDTISSSGRKEKDLEKEGEHPGEPSLLPPMPAYTNGFPNGMNSDPNLPSTMAHASTPGWDMPWSSKLAAQGPHPQYSHMSEDSDQDERVSTKDELVGWAARRKRIRSFILSNPYVPLVRSHITLLPFPEVLISSNLAFSIHQYFLHHRCSRHGHSHSAAGIKTQCYGCRW